MSDTMFKLGGGSYWQQQVEAADVARRIEGDTKRKLKFHRVSL